jgi:mannosyltransferase OCH1-like enzyme
MNVFYRETDIVGEINVAFTKTTNPSFKYFNVTKLSDVNSLMPEIRERFLSLTPEEQEEFFPYFLIYSHGGIFISSHYRPCIFLEELLTCSYVDRNIIIGKRGDMFLLMNTQKEKEKKGKKIIYIQGKEAFMLYDKIDIEYELNNIYNIELKPEKRIWQIRDNKTFFSLSNTEDTLYKVLTIEEVNDICQIFFTNVFCHNYHTAKLALLYLYGGLFISSSVIAVDKNLKLSSLFSLLEEDVFIEKDHAIYSKIIHCKKHNPTILQALHECLLHPTYDFDPLPLTKIPIKESTTYPNIEDSDLSTLQSDSLPPQNFNSKHTQPFTTDSLPPHNSNSQDTQPFTTDSLPHNFNSQDTQPFTTDSLSPHNSNSQDTQSFTTDSLPHNFNSEKTDKLINFEDFLIQTFKNSATNIENTERENFDIENIVTEREKSKTVIENIATEEEKSDTVVKNSETCALQLEDFMPSNAVVKNSVTENFAMPIEENEKNEDLISHKKKREIEIRDNKIYYNDRPLFLIEEEKREKRKNEDTVPLHIWQTWSTRDMPINMQKAVDTLKERNPEFTHTVYDDHMCEEYIQNHFPHLLSLYKSIIPGAYRADIFRYCILYNEGGVYVDIKYVPVSKISKFIHIINNDYFCLDRGEYFTKLGIYNAVLISKKKNPLFYYALKEIKERCERQEYRVNSLYFSGPGLLGELYDHFYDRKNLIMHNVNSEFIFLKDNAFLRPYHNYREDQRREKDYKSYNELWLRRKCFSLPFIQEYSHILSFLSFTSLEREEKNILKIDPCDYSSTCLDSISSYFPHAKVYGLTSIEFVKDKIESFNSIENMHIKDLDFVIDNTYNSVKVFLSVETYIHHLTYFLSLLNKRGIYILNLSYVDLNESVLMALYKFAQIRRDVKIEFIHKGIKITPCI